MLKSGTDTQQTPALIVTAWFAAHATLERVTECWKTLKSWKKKRQIPAASALLQQQVPDEMMCCKWNIEAKTVNIVHWKLNKSQDLGAQRQNNMMVGRQKLSVLDRVFLDSFCSLHDILKVCIISPVNVDSAEEIGPKQESLAKCCSSSILHPDSTGISQISQVIVPSPPPTPVTLSLTWFTSRCVGSHQKEKLSVENGDNQRDRQEVFISGRKAPAHSVYYTTICVESGSDLIHYYDHPRVKKKPLDSTLKCG
jgi:hypothetical protein